MLSVATAASTVAVDVVDDVTSKLPNNSTHVLFLRNHIKITMEKIECHLYLEMFIKF